MGVQDQINLKFSKQLFAFQAEKILLLENDEELPDHMKKEITQELLDMEKNEPKRMFNPFLELKGFIPAIIFLSKMQDLTLNPSNFNPFFLSGFDTVKDTPVEVLHAFLVGPVKYLFCTFMKGLNATQKSELLALWNSFNTNSLNIPSIRPTSMVQYCSSLIGKEFKIILQSAPFLFFRFMTPSQINIWSFLCHLGTLIFQAHIENMDSYILEYMAAAPPASPRVYTTAPYVKGP